MIDYIPRGKVREALLFIDEEGAQFTDALAAHLDMSANTLPSTLLTAMHKGVIGKVLRIKNDGRRSNLWHLTEKGAACLDRIRQAQAGQ